MTTLSFDAGYAAFQSDSALFGRPPAMPAFVRRLVASRHAEVAAATAARAALALLPFSALAWMFLAR